LTVNGGANTGTFVWANSTIWQLSPGLFDEIQVKQVVFGGNPHLLP
jgi:hypothetical protein